MTREKSTNGSIMSLDISTWAKTVLRRHGVTDVSTLREKSKADLLRMRNLGKETLREIVAALAERNLRLRNS